MRDGTALHERIGGGGMGMSAARRLGQSHRVVLASQSAKKNADRESALREDGIEGVLLGFGEATGRLAVLDRVRAAGLALPSFVHPTALVSPTASLAEGVQVLAGAYVGPDARLGPGALVNTRAIVEHDGVLAVDPLTHA